MKYGLALAFLAGILFAFQNCGRMIVPGQESKLSDGSSAPLPMSVMSGSAVATCRALIHKQITLEKDVPLTCDGNGVPLFNYISGDLGPAVAQVRVRYRNTSNETYYWANWVSVGGDFVGSDRKAISTAIGDDICPGTVTEPKGNMGYGYLSASSRSVKVMAYQGVAGCNTNSGPVVALAGSTLDIWIEDPSPACLGRNVGFASVLSRNTGPGPVNLGSAVWSPSMALIKALPLPNLSGRSGKLTLIAVNEGSTPEVNISNPPPVCGSEVLSLTSQITTNGGVQLDLKQEKIPASQGMSHLVLLHHKQIPLSELGGATGLLLRGGTSFTSPEVFTGTHTTAVDGEFHESMGDSKIAYAIEDSAAAVPPSEVLNPPAEVEVGQPGVGSCAGNDCGWTEQENLAIRCQYADEKPIGIQKSGKCADAGALNFYEWSPMVGGGCAAGTYLRYRVTQQCAHSAPPSCASGQCGWVTTSDNPVACQYASQAPVGKQLSGTCDLEGAVNIYEWGTGVSGGCTSPTYLRNRVIQECKRVAKK